MQSTPPSLLDRLRNQDDQYAWQEFVELYTPLLYGWSCRAGLQDSDAADLLQDVFATLFQKLPEFRYDPSRSFRAWLRTVAMNHWRDACRKRQRQGLENNEADLADAEASDELGAAQEAEYRQYLVGRALRLMQAEFEATTWKACWEFVVCGRSAADVAAELSISENAVYISKSRVLRRLRQELEGLLD